MDLTPRDPPWSEHEKVYLLAEILKAAPIPSDVLFRFIRDNHLRPRWTDTALPTGRSVRSSQMAFDNMLSIYMTPAYARPALPMPTAHPTGPSSYPPSDAMSKKRPLPIDNPAAGRHIQPRPLQPYAPEFMPAGGPAYASAAPPTNDSANKKKRGRPTKKEQQQKAEAAAARGEVYPPPKRQRPTIAHASSSEPQLDRYPSPGRARPDWTPSEGTWESQRYGQTPPQPATAQAARATTPQQPIKPESGSDSSSSRKKRPRPAPLNLPKLRTPKKMPSPTPHLSTDANRSQAYSTFTPVSATLPVPNEPRASDARMEGMEQTPPQQQQTTPHSFKDVVGI